MGMYNEAYKACPECGRLAETQISQIVLGFGEFDLDNPERLAEDLTAEQLLELREKIEGEWFDCKSCDHSFQFASEDDKAERLELARKLFG